MNTDRRQDKTSNTGTAPGVAGAKREIMLADNRINSADLFAGIREITISHGDDIYRLRLTAQNKLILTK